jgi:hypothetical protein
VADRFDVIVVGAGSGGFGAACAAARLGSRTLLIEATAGVGGTSTWAGVNNWEPVAGATSLPAELWDRLRLTGDICLQRRRCSYHPDRPWGWFDRDLASSDYRHSLSRATGMPVTFEPAALDAAMRQMLTESNCQLRLSTRFTDVEVDRTDQRLKAIFVEDDQGQRERLEADQFIDATADIHLARAVGCQTRLGPESAAIYNEPSATDVDGLVLNNATPCYRIHRIADGESPEYEPWPEDSDVAIHDLRPVTSIRTYPNGDLNMNPLYLMTGVEALELGETAREIAFRRARAHWHLLQTQHGFDRWRLTWMSPALGIRETHRLVGRYVLREQDLEAGLDRQEHEDVITFADHAIDFHGSRPSREVPNGPYGVPLRCLLPSEVDNLLVACRGASFSSIGASSCRLSRTMMMLGQAAGTAAAVYGREAVAAATDTRISKIRDQLSTDGVALDLAEGWLDAMPGIEPLPQTESGKSQP